MHHLLLNFCYCYNCVCWPSIFDFFYKWDYSPWGLHGPSVVCHSYQKMDRQVCTFKFLYATPLWHVKKKKKSSINYL